MADPEMDLRRNILTGNYDRYSRIQMAVVAQELGLDPDTYAQQFPGNNTTKNITFNNYPNQTPVSPEIKVTHPPVALPVAKKGLSTLAAVALTALTFAVPAAGAIGYLIAAKPAVTSTIEKIIDRPVEKIIKQPGTNYDVDVDMEVIPPPQKE